MEKTARLFHCMRCHCQVTICSTCDRGNIYCGSVCASTARVSSVRAAGKRYQQSYQGRLKHAARQRRYRERENKKVTHQGSQENVDHSQSLPQPATVISALHCHFCNKCVPDHLRSGFLERSSWIKASMTETLAQGP